MMDWSFCVICGGEGDLKCPANSNQDNGLGVYGRFLETVAEFRYLESLSVSVKFNDEYDAEMFFLRIRQNGTRHAI